MRFAHWVRRHALAICAANLAFAAALTVGSAVLWAVAIITGLVHSIAFISHISIAALLLAGLSSIGAGVAAYIALVPTDDIIDGDE